MSPYLQRVIHTSLILFSAILLLLFSYLASTFAAPTGTDPDLDITIGPNNSFVSLENSKIRVVYEPFTDGHAQFAIKQFIIKSVNNQNQVGPNIQNRYMEADAQRGVLLNAQIVTNTDDVKTVELTWRSKFNPDETIVHRVSIFPHSNFIKMRYRDIQYGVNIVDIGEPGGDTNGEHFFYGGDSWIRGYVTQQNQPTVGSYYNRYSGDNVNDPANGGSLNCNSHFVMGVFNNNTNDPNNGVGFARSIPVSQVSIVKLLVGDQERRGFELFPHPFFQPHNTFSGYLYGITDGEDEVMSIAQEAVPNGPPTCAETPPPLPFDSFVPIIIKDN